MLAEAAAPGATVREVSRRLGIAESLIYNCRSAARRAQRIASEPLQFIPYGMVVSDVAPVESNSASSALPIRQDAASPACQRRLRNPQKCRSKIPHFAVRGKRCS